ncbi:MAG: hydrogenase maturation protease [Anaeromyxobacter sp.]|nr:hydrogenase maturation protease [Anaeromyxobacter sp.]MBL0275041.1 hydrogenase maturation protease [Anaeromyxobacter sp.]
MARITVIGIGNVLEGDDALGPTVVRLFEAAYTVPEDVSVVDGGTPGLDLTAYMAELEALVVVDAMKLKGGAPGQLKVLDKPGILDRGPIIAMSPHEPGLRESIMHAEFQGVAPRVVKLIGVVAGSIDFGCRLTPEVRAALPAAVEQVRLELLALGVPVAPRVPPLEADLWWEKPQHT